MAHILITAGPTRQYLDPVRYLTNASSGQMGQALAEAALEAGHRVIIVSGPVGIDYPTAADVIHVVSTEEMLVACRQAFPKCDGMIGVAAPCDYRPTQVEENKITKTGQPLQLHLIETPDIVATLAAEKGSRWVVGFALETEDHRFRALAKLERKTCDLIVLNEPSAMNSSQNQVEVIDRQGVTVASVSGLKIDVARRILEVIHERLM